ncbi:6-phosphogluconate dehydrogenase [Thermanaerothrix daxensis]|uniref:6-phosphogluconate dehydrogenase, decarboxylating n=1 Tax=Thermanaerothrix daxensis TaxID=869279 RepID=A0A0P6XP20_9CHLR|nr:NADP-dependent phosphogluconate dehydrogenase [Thermanaerothrix daxensis]KPL84412.1 6-phosphogluconate dehydrogenase [Thermanaerothrix daxensis]
MRKANIGVVGLGVMGHNLALNFERHGYWVAVYNRTAEKTRNMIASAGPERRLIGTFSLEELCANLERPRRILLMVQAGQAVDEMITSLRPFLQSGDILIDGGNSYFQDTERRHETLKGAGILYVGMGISGGEEGALWGPSLMPGGPLQAWESLAPMLRDIAAKAEDGEPCVDYIGPRGAGHYVKMVHNGIEYADMQLIAETYDLLKRALGLSAPQLAEIFAEWNQGELQSYLIQITAEVLRKIDEETGQPLVDLIMDEAQQKGTGKWTSQNALDIGAAVPTISAAVDMRILSALKQERVQASQVLRGPTQTFRGDPEHLLHLTRKALYASKIIAYAQGMGLLRQASQEYGYNLKLDRLAAIWRAGCIIRARLLSDITLAYQREPGLVNLLLAPVFREALASHHNALREVLKIGLDLGIPMMGMSTALAYYDAYRSARLPANLIQAQRDYFGAHTYRRLDREGIFHTQWT